MDSLHTFVVLAYKESEYLEDCIKSVLNQRYPSKVVIGTSTMNKFICDMANKYNIKLIINKEKKGIGSDFNFAFNCANTELVTIAHQDDIYDYDFSYQMVERFKKNKNSLIIFSDYYEIKNNLRINTNTNLKIKRVLLSPLKVKFFAKFTVVQKFSLAFGNSICCPAVTFVKSNLLKNNYFESDMKSNVDWLAWVRISNEKGMFSYISKQLMGHRVHEKSATSSIINDNVRTKEDFMIFSIFWPKPIAKCLTKLFKMSEISNKD